MSLKHKISRKLTFKLVLMWDFKKVSFIKIMLMIVSDMVMLVDKTFWSSK